MATVQGQTNIEKEKIKTVDFSVWPKGEPNTAYAQYFIGNSYLADTACSVLYIGI